MTPSAPLLFPISSFATCFKTPTLYQMSPSNTPKNPDQSSCRNKKSHVACVQCRERKVRCSGSFPCANCSRRSVECIFEPEDRKIIVSENYFNELKRKAGEDGNSQPTKKRHPSDKSPRDQHTSLGEASHQTADANCDLGADSGDENFSALTNPLVMTPSQVVTDTEGRARFLGPSSTWAYSRHIMGMIKQHLNHNLSPDVPLNVDGAAFPIKFPSTGRLGLSISMEDLPSLDYALYLTNTVKFHVGQTYHLFHEQTFMQRLFSLYKDSPEPLNATNRMWFVQFFLVMALGMALLARGVSTTSPPGRDYFIRAVDLFPDINGLYQDTITSVEVCCGLALYLQSVDHRNSAYVYLGLGLRVALSQGYHRDVVSDLDAYTDMTRHRNVWWTLYILDRKFSSLIGAPSSVHDSDISVPLPMYQKSTQKTCALDMHVRLSRLLAKVLNTVYCVDGRLNSSFLKNIQATVRELADLAVELNATPELKLNNSGPVSRLSATLNLCYHQCMVLATRPLLVCLLHDRLDRRASKTRQATIIIDPVKALLKTSHDSAQKSLRILATLQAQGLLGKPISCTIFETCVINRLFRILPPF
ncbi:fungal-specific transcription factor domain-containing protein [Ilyonectria sp. MPI-CAGE-AT-0026]|nr:fungal-specific transcription factor domain-containing protein [Ilyonectria sp. MPI-CAGE-AT-0026]